MLSADEIQWMEFLLMGKLEDKFWKAMASRYGYIKENECVKYLV